MGTSPARSSVVACSRLAWVLISLPMSLLAVGGAAKLLNLAAFFYAVRSWTLIPKPLIVPVVLIVPALELCLALSWFMGLKGRRASALGSVALFIVFAAFYGAHLWRGERPSCGCFAQLAMFDHLAAEGRWLLWRNTSAALLIAIGLAMWEPKRRGPHDLGAVPRELHPSTTRQAGFTLLETLIVVALTGILVALLSPALRAVRARAIDTASIASLRSHAQIFSQYTSDSRGYWPWPGTPAAIGGPPSANSVPYFAMHAAWPLLLADGYYDGQRYGAQFTSPANPNRSAGEMDYWYSCSFLAAPAFWNPRFRTGPMQWGATRDHQVRFASAKALLVDAQSFLAGNQVLTGRPLRAGFCDGSAQVVHQDRWMRAAHPSGDGWWNGCMHGTVWPPMHHTLDGVQGRDLR